MFNLVRNELTKIFSKKGIYIVLVVFLLLTSLILGIEKYSEKMLLSGTTESAMTYLDEEIEELDTSTDEGKVQYWSLQTEKEVNQLAKEYGGYSTWQGEKILNEIWAIKMDMNLYENELEEFAIYTTYSKEELQKEYDKIMARINKGDRQSFL